MALTLVIGGARSGKTRHALTLAEDGSSGGRRVMIATAEALDDEMAARIARHRADRGDAWTTLEAPLDLAGAVGSLRPDDVAVIDCLTFWISNLMHSGYDLTKSVAALTANLSTSPTRVILVTNEVGQGIVPDNALARRFRDEAGWANQALATAADTVILVTAGLPLTLKG